ncbi:hypothetical protein Lser_V15G05076 [Lactuca serriola]
MWNTYSKISIPMHMLTMLMMLSFMLASRCPTDIQQCHNGENYYITCNNESVVEIYIYRCNESDMIKVVISSFPSVERLYVSDSNLTGNILHQIGLLKNLTYVSLTWNYNTGGTLPVFFTKLTRLEHLDLSDNNLSGNLPSQLWSLKNLTLAQLEHLDLSGNSFIGTLSSFGSMINLKFLDLSINQLRGPIPQELCNLQKLETLNLSMNNISGSIPPHIEYLKNIKQLDLNHNQLSGVIHLEFRNLSSLSYLDFSSNHLSDNFLTGYHGLNNCYYLSYLDLSDNIFVGETVNCLNFLWLEYYSLNVSRLYLGYCTETNFLRKPSKAHKHILLLVILLPIIVGFCFLVIGYMCARY